MSTAARSAKVDLALVSATAGQGPGSCWNDTHGCRFSAAASLDSRKSAHFGTAGALLNFRRVLKRFVYVLRNGETPPRYYTGITSDAARRLAEHNGGSCVHTGKYRPWSIDVVIEFPDERRAVAFERYLKSGSGVAFAQRHLR